MKSEKNLKNKIKSVPCLFLFLSPPSPSLCSSSQSVPTLRQIVSTSRDRSIKLWNTLGECKYTIRDGDAHSDWVSCVRFSPNNLQPTIVSSSWDRTVKIWKLTNCKIRASLAGHSGCVNTVAVSPDGSLCASGGKDGVILLWDLAEGKKLYSLDSGSIINMNNPPLFVSFDCSLIFDFLSYVVKHNFSKIYTYASCSYYCFVLGPVYADGSICLDILQNQWSPIYDIANLQSNGLTGKLPSELGNLKYLEELRLDRNKLQGNAFAINSQILHPACMGYSEMLKDVLRFSRQELEVACEDFSNIIGSSPDSLVYKGTMKGGPEIAVISLCIKEEHWTGYLELYYQREENYWVIAQICKPFTRMLVFEYASNRTLYEHLHCKSK
ncbi:hypothetical protein LOK49_LG09G00821, partial [Camellia lanceoleosa]